MAALRTPVTGCPWDLEQNFATIAPYTIEEAYEVADAIERGDIADLRDELGDLLLQVVFHARMAEEAGHFDFRRRGRGDHRQADPPPSACLRQCARSVARRGQGALGPIKAEEKHDRLRRGASRRAGRAARRRAGGRAARPAGSDARGEAAGESRQGRLRLERRPCRARQIARGDGGDRGGAWRRAMPKAVKGEVGDLLFVVANLARHLTSIRKPRCARQCEIRAALRPYRGGSASRVAREASLEEMDALWDEAKAASASPREDRTVTNAGARRHGHRSGLFGASVASRAAKGSSKGSSSNSRLQTAPLIATTIASRRASSAIRLSRMVRSAAR